MMERDQLPQTYILLDVFLTSRRVWGTMDGFQITAKVCGSYQLLPEPPSTDAVPEPYKNLCAQCTRLNQAERPSALAVLHQLMAL